MTVIETTSAATRNAPRSAVGDRVPAGRNGRTCANPSRPARRRPGGAPMRYPGTGVRMSRAPHGRQPGASRPITPAATVALALVAAAITVWLGLMAHFGATMADAGTAMSGTTMSGAAAAGSGAALPERLSVVRVERGETLQHLAARVAPDAPTGAVVDRIRELNGLNCDGLNFDGPTCDGPTCAGSDMALVAAGQTLIAPIG